MTDSESSFLKIKNGDVKPGLFLRDNEGEKLVENTIRNVERATPMA